MVFKNPSKNQLKIISFWAIIVVSIKQK